MKVETTQANSLFLKLQIKDSNIYLEFFFDENYVFLDVCINIYKNKEEQLSWGGSIKEIIFELNKYITKSK